MEEMSTAQQKLKILLLLSESWNDISAPNNNVTNWFSNFSNVEIWTISGSGSLPNNSCCKDYFLISEREMLKSLLTFKKVGKAYHYENFPAEKGVGAEVVSKTPLFKETKRLFRDIVWRFGKYDQKKLGEFISAFQPDIIFSQRKGSIKMCRMERLVSKLANVPMVAYTGDDEFSLRQFSLV